MPQILQSLISLGSSRKVLVTAVTWAAAWCAQHWMNITPAELISIIASGSAIVLGIAHEDAAAKANENTAISAKEAKSH